MCVCVSVCVWLLLSIVVLCFPLSPRLPWVAFSGFSRALGIRDAASSTSQEDMETDRQAVEDLTTTGQSAEQQHRAVCVHTHYNSVWMCLRDPRYCLAPSPVQPCLIICTNKCNQGLTGVWYTFSHTLKYNQLNEIWPSFQADFYTADILLEGFSVPPLLFSVLVENALKVHYATFLRAVNK